jgi:hypothetical protein
MWLNPNVVYALRKKSVYWGNRQDGKTFTLLSFIALTVNTKAIVVCKNDYVLRHNQCLWGDYFMGFQSPRFITIGMKNQDGLSGTVFTDGCMLNPEWCERLNQSLQDGGGVMT